MKWEKLGRVLHVEGLSDVMVTHARLPVPTPLGNGIYRIYFNSRDAQNRERVFYTDIDIRRPTEPIRIETNPVIDLGPLGGFDDNGVTCGCCLDVGAEKYLYFAGWNRLINVPFSTAIGLAISKDGGATFERAFPGPVLDRSKDEPFFVSINDVVYEDGRFRTWYLFCVGWERREAPATPLHRYHIRYAESDDGVSWHRAGRVAIDFANTYEYAISTPRVLPRPGGGYHMWFSYRGQPGIETYRIGYAVSEDGVSWQRQDDRVGIDVSEEGWDSEMICYPAFIRHEDELFMLYNGNGYGRTGFGLARLVDD